MPCHSFLDDDGKPIGIVCSGRGRTKTCARKDCRKRSTKLCDHKLENGKTCDAAMCDTHAQHAGPDIDYCGDHKVVLW